MLIITYSTICIFFILLKQEYNDIELSKNIYKLFKCRVSCISCCNTIKCIDLSVPKSCQIHSMGLYQDMRAV